MIKLDGADTPITHVVKDIPFNEMRIGLDVKAEFAKKGPSNILAIDHFSPTEKRKKPQIKLGRPYEDLEIGMTASFSKTISESDIYLFAGITGDFYDHSPFAAIWCESGLA